MALHGPYTLPGMPTPTSGTEPAFSDYLRELRRNWKIVAIIPVVLAAVALGLSLAQDKVYTATADVLIQRAPTRATLISDSPPDLATELILARGPSVREAAIARLGFPIRATVQRVGETTVIRIVVEAPTRDQAMKAADAYGAAFIELRTRHTIAALQATRQELETKLAEVNGSGDGTLDAAQVEEIATLADSLRNSARQNPAALRSALAALQRIGETGAPTSNQVIRSAALQLLIDEMEAAETLARNSAPELVSPAQASRSPIRPAPLRNAVVGAALGLMLAIGGLLVRSYLDRLVHDAPTLQAATGVPVLGVLVRRARRASGSRRSPGDAGWLDMQELRTALQLRGVGETVRTVQLTSPRRLEGMADLGLELGAAFARAELSVLVVEADFRRPRTAEGGTGGLWGGGSTDIETLLASAPALDGVRRISAGGIPEDPAAFLGSGRFRNLITDLGTRADLVLVVSPPVLESPDPLLIGRVVDTTVVVVSPGATRVTDAAEAAARFREVNHSVLGAVLATAGRRPWRDPGLTPNRAPGGELDVASGTNGDSARPAPVGSETDPSASRHG